MPDTVCVKQEALVCDIVSGGKEGLTGREKVDHNSRREGALPLTPHTKELSPVKDHRYRRRRRRVGGGWEEGRGERGQ